MKILARFNFEEHQLAKFQKLTEIYPQWNQKINVISRKDIKQFSVHHLLHSLTLLQVFDFKGSHRILDIGTGGGFPGIPLAIAFPEKEFVLVDSIQKKIRVVEAVKEALDLPNVTPIASRVEEMQESSFDAIVSRAVAPAKTLIYWSHKLLNPKGHFVFLKGGDLTAELKGLTQTSYNLKAYQEADFFETKKVVVIPASSL